MQLLFVITDSGQTRDQEPSTPLDRASLPLKNKGIEVYALGVGDKVPEQNLRDIASRPQNVFRPVSSVNDLPQRRPAIVENWRTYLRGWMRLCLHHFVFLVFLAQGGVRQEGILRWANLLTQQPLRSSDQCKHNVHFCVN